MTIPVWTTESLHTLGESVFRVSIIAPHFGQYLVLNLNCITSNCKLSKYCHDFLNCFQVIKLES